MLADSSELQEHEKSEAGFLSFPALGRGLSFFWLLFTYSAPVE